MAVHRPFYLSICISTLPTQDTTFITALNFNLSKNDTPLSFLVPGRYGRDRGRLEKRLSDRATDVSTAMCYKSF